MNEEKQLPQGLTSSQASERQHKYGKNELVPLQNKSFIKKLLHTLSEPMFILLLAAATIYFILGEARDGIIMLVFVIGIISIDVIQEWKTDKTLDALKDLSSLHAKIIRDGQESKIATVDISQAIIGCYKQEKGLLQNTPFLVCIKTSGLGKGGISGISMVQHNLNGGFAEFLP